MKVLIINGPNLNLLGTREPEIYGSETLDEIMNKTRDHARQYDLEIEDYQSNVEGELIDKIHAAKKFDGIIINAAAYTHTSVAIHDALKSYAGKVIEVHLSNPHAREDFRHQSYISPVADGVIAGFKANSYLLAVDAMAEFGS